MNSNKQFIADPFFILYDARSGSTFLANLLIKNSSISIPPESDFIPFIFVHYPKKSIDNKQDLEIIMDIIYGDSKFSDWDIARTTIRKIVEDKLPMSIRDFILSICTIFRDKFQETVTFGIKKGSYMSHYKTLKELFPKSKFIGIIRDGRAVFNSKKNSIYSRTGKPFEKNPIKAAKEWREILEWLREIKRGYKDDTLIIYYEKLVEDTKHTIRSVCRFLGVPYTPNNTSTDRRYFVPKRYGDLHKNIEKKALLSRTSAWQESLTQAEVFAYELVIYDQLLSNGYELVNSYGLLKCLKKIYGMVKYIRFLDKKLERYLIKKWDEFLLK